MGVQNRQAPLDVFVGRTAELARVAEVVARVEAGEPWLVAVEGDPGMGKTALARRCLAGAAGLRVLQARASLAEADLDFGIADQLFRTVGGALLTGGASVSTSSFAVARRADDHGPDPDPGCTGGLPAGGRLAGDLTAGGLLVRGIELGAHVGISVFSVLVCG